MAETKAGESAEELASEERWERYRQMALTPEQVAKGRAELQKEIDSARAEGVYEKLIEWRARESRMQSPKNRLSKKIAGLDTSV